MRITALATRFGWLFLTRGNCDRHTLHRKGKRSVAMLTGICSKPGKPPEFHLSGFVFGQFLK
jgi:hypothetical protein